MDRLWPSVFSQKLPDDLHALKCGFVFGVGGGDPGGPDRIRVDVQPAPPGDVGVAGGILRSDPKSIIRSCQQVSIEAVQDYVNTLGSTVYRSNRRGDRGAVLEVKVAHVRDA